MNMNRTNKILVIIILLVAIGIVTAAKHFRYRKVSEGLENESVIGRAGMPVLLELGSVDCIPCKAMMPILKELKKEYASSLKVAFIDVWKDTEAAKRYEVSSIPTQIFFDSSGKELFRHTGFFAKEKILAKWKEFGVELRKEK